MSDAQEKRTAKEYDGAQNYRSGAGWVKKGDVRTDRFMIENKLRMKPDAKSYTLNATTMRDLVRQATLEGRIGLLQLDLGGKRYVVLSESDFLDLIES